jgi:hypothetical protein
MNALTAHITSHHTIMTHHIYQNIKTTFFPLKNQKGGGGGVVDHAQTSVKVFSRKFNIVMEKPFYIWANIVT